MNIEDIAPQMVQLGGVGIFAVAVYHRLLAIEKALNARDRELFDLLVYLVQREAGDERPMLPPPSVRMGHGRE